MMGRHASPEKPPCTTPEVHRHMAQDAIGIVVGGSFAVIMLMLFPPPVNYIFTGVFIFFGILGLIGVFLKDHDHHKEFYHGPPPQHRR